MFQDGSVGTSFGYNRNSHAILKSGRRFRAARLRHAQRRPRETYAGPRRVDRRGFPPRAGGTSRFTVKNEGLTPARAMFTRAWLSFAAEGYAPRRCRLTIPGGFVGSNLNIESTRRYPPAAVARRHRTAPRRRQRNAGRVYLAIVSLPGPVTSTVEFRRRPLEVPPAYPLDGFTDSLTLSSKCFSTFPHGTCPL